MSCVCEAIDGPCDGILFKTASIYTRVHVACKLRFTTPNLDAFDYWVADKPFTGSTLYFYDGTCHETGIHTYTHTVCTPYEKSTT